MGCEQSRANFGAQQYPHSPAYPPQPAWAPAAPHFRAGAPPPPHAAQPPYAPPAQAAQVPYAPSGGPMIEVGVAHLTGRKDTVSVPVNCVIAELKRAIEAKSGHPVQAQRLVFAGRQLDDGNTLGSYSIQKGATVHLVLRRASPGEVAAGGQQVRQQPRPDLQDLLDCYEVSIAAADDLRCLEAYDIVFLLDDSGSMSREETTSGVTQSRWKELRDTTRALIEFATYFDDDGTDIHFLNRPSVEGVTDPKDPRLEQAFEGRPRGRTPLTDRLRQVVTGHHGKKPLLVVLATDGEPDQGVGTFVAEVRRLINNPQRRDVRLAVMACTQDERQVRWLNDLDDDEQVGDKIDVCDDYEAERDEVLGGGRVRQFLISDYYVKALLGPILSKYDNLDQLPVQHGARLYKGARDGARPRGGRGGAARGAYDDGRAPGTLAQRRAGRAPSAAGAACDSVVPQLTRLFVLHRAGALDAAQFADAKATVLGLEE